MTTRCLSFITIYHFRVVLFYATSFIKPIAGGVDARVRARLMKDFDVEARSWQEAVVS